MPSAPSARVPFCQLSTLAMQAETRAASPRGRPCPPCCWRRIVCPRFSSFPSWPPRTRLPYRTSLFVCSACSRPLLSPLLAAGGRLSPRGPARPHRRLHGAPRALHLPSPLSQHTALPLLPSHPTRRPRSLPFSQHKPTPPGPPRTSSAPPRPSTTSSAASWATSSPPSSSSRRARRPPSSATPRRSPTPARPWRAAPPALSFPPSTLRAPPPAAACARTRRRGDCSSCTAPQTLTQRTLAPYRVRTRARRRSGRSWRCSPRPSPTPPRPPPSRRSAFPPGSISSATTPEPSAWPGSAALAPALDWFDCAFPCPEAEAAACDTQVSSTRR